MRRKPKRRRPAKRVKRKKLCRICKHREREKHRTKCSTCRSREDRRKYPLRNYYENAKHHAKERGIGWQLTFAFFEHAAKTFGLVQKLAAGEDWTIDRVEADQPYSDDNIDFKTRSANSTKWNNHDRKKRHPHRYGKP